MENYNIGLDIGTTSVGWAVVNDATNKVMRKGGKALWGVRLFDPAVTAEDRRAKRGTRRRYDRRRERIKLLQDEFKDEINKVDSTFFLKLEESKYTSKDIKNKTVLISMEEEKAIKKYNQEYPTIYHLRQKLINSNEQVDIRLVYLAIHHIIKYRGNFNYEGKTFNIEKLDISGKLQEVFMSLSENVSELDISQICFNNIDYIAIAKILNENPKSQNDLKVDLNAELVKGFLNKKFIKEFCQLLVGSEFNIKNLFNIDIEKDIKISFAGNDLEEQADTLEKVLGDYMEILEQLKELYDMVFLKKMFGDSKETTLSGLMVERYNQHKKDLKLLKDTFSSDRKIYNKIFRSKKDIKDDKDMCLYDLYIHNKLETTDFLKEIKKYINTDSFVINDENFLKRLENNEVLPRITSKENGKYPYQLNKDELVSIIEHQGKHYPFLLNKTDDKSDYKTFKLVRLLEFKIPYFVGPLVSREQSDNAWMIRNEGKEHEHIDPYNFNLVVNKEESAIAFITKMTRCCTYLLNEKALPNNSILYSEFKVLNELKQIKINGEHLTQEEQHKIIEELFMKTSGPISKNKFEKFLINKLDYGFYEDVKITGYSADGKFANNMQSYVDFFGEDGIFKDTSYNTNDAEKIIEWITIFDDKDILKRKVENEYPELKKNNQVKNILNKKYSGWGRLSRKLLLDLRVLDKETDIPKSIMDLMYETDENFMQIINDDKYNFQKLIAKENKLENTSNDLSYDVVENLATSPATKRGIYQALKVVKEITTYMGYEPKNIMVEMARGDEKKIRKDDRKKYLQKLYDNIKDEVDSNYKNLKKEIAKEEKIDTDKLYLYYLQEGKCLYCGKPINVDDLNTKNSLYEIDHILPRTLVKDNSWDNRALVCRECNQDKGASLVLPSKFNTEKTRKLWNRLKDNKLMSNKKFYLLTRKKYSEEDIKGFINRQLVETRQITKHVANILNCFYPKTKIVYLKANISHSYRDKYDLFKFRDINDYHHAHDAYLAATLGSYQEKYLHYDLDYNKINEFNEKLIKNEDYKRLHYGIVVNSLDEEFQSAFAKIAPRLINEETGELLFNAKEFNDLVEDTLYRNDILISRKTEIKTGEFYNQTKSKKGSIGVQLKKNMPTELYGSYTSINPSYAVMLKYTSKNKDMQRLVGFPIYLENTTIDVKKEYFRKLLKLKPSDKVEIINKKIPFYSLINWDNQLCYLIGASNKIEVCNAIEFKYRKDFMKNNKYVLNKIFNGKNSEKINDYSLSLDSIINYIIDSIENDYKLFANLIIDLKNMTNNGDYSIFSIEQKEKIIKELTNLLNIKSDNANFKFLNDKYSSAFGKKNGRIIENCNIICVSPAGLKKKAYEL